MNANSDLIRSGHLQSFLQSSLPPGTPAAGSRGADSAGRPGKARAVGGELPLGPGSWGSKRGGRSRPLFRGAQATGSQAHTAWVSSPPGMSALSASDQTAGLREAGLVPWSVTALGTGAGLAAPRHRTWHWPNAGRTKAEEAGRLGGERAHSSGGRFRDFPLRRRKSPRDFGLRAASGRGRTRTGGAGTGGASPQNLANYRPGTGPGRPGLLRARLSAPASPASPSGDRA